MLQVKEIINKIFTSKTYILYHKGDEIAWLIDIGGIKPVLTFCSENDLTVAGVFLTHGHFDHIYGLPSLMNHYPSCNVYTTEYGKHSLASEKLNLSRYHVQPIKCEGDNYMGIKYNL